MPDKPNIDVPSNLWEMVRDILQKHIPQNEILRYSEASRARIQVALQH